MLLLAPRRWATHAASHTMHTPNMVIPGSLHRVAAVPPNTHPSSQKMEVRGFPSACVHLKHMKRVKFTLQADTP